MPPAMRRLVPFGAVVVYLLGSSVWAAESVSELFQPVESRSHLSLESVRGRARIERQGGATQRINLRSDELLTTIAETRGGWTAAGVREEESSTGLIVIERSGQGTQRLAPPALQRHPWQIRPALAVRGDELAGMAWLEGPDLSSLSVRTAARAEGTWRDVTIVAPPARGSQTGLVLIVMDDGNWLLVWSAFDGKDDEILWSTGQQDGWSVPRRLGKNNSVPDIMPALVSTPDGALLTWSRLIDGQYQLMMSKFEAGGFSQPRVFGPPGSLEPGFVVLDGRLLLLYRHAWPQGWAITELSTDGRMQRLAVLSDGTPSRPILVRSSGENVELRWAGSRRQAIGWEALP